MIKHPIYGSKYFDVRHYVDRKTFNLLGVRAAHMIDRRLVAIDDLFAEKVGTEVIINNWHTGGSFDSSGFRPIWDSTGGKLSQHRCGRASDKKVKGMTPKQMLEVILDNRAEFLELGLTTIENIAFTPSWLHTDCRYLLPGVVKDGEFWFVNP